MASIGFIGLGIMGGPMARNILRGGHALTVFDVNADAVAKLVEPGAVCNAPALTGTTSERGNVKRLDTSSFLHEFSNTRPYSDFAGSAGRRITGWSSA